MTAKNNLDRNEQHDSSAVSIAGVSDDQLNTSEAEISIEELTKLSLTLLSSEFVCSLSQQIMVDPVTTIAGNSYERENIKKHFTQEKTDPITKVALVNHTLIPNYLLKNIIENHNTLVTNISKATQEVLKKINAQKEEIKDLSDKCASLTASLAAYRDLAKQCELDDEKQAVVADEKENFSFILKHFESIQEEITALKSDFDCPISMDTMADPCMASDGHTYERAEIAEWFRNKKISPKTGINLQNTNFMPNHNLRQLLIEGDYLTRLADLSKSVSDAHQAVLKALEAQTQMIRALSAKIDLKTAHLERCKFSEQAQQKQQEAIVLVVLDFVRKMEDFIKIQSRIVFWIKNSAAGFVGEVIQTIIEGPDAYQRLIEKPEEHLLTLAITVFVSEYVQQHEDLWKLHNYPNFAKRLRDTLYRTKYEGKSKEFIKKLFQKKPKEKKNSIQMEVEEKEEASARIYMPNNIACQTFQLPIVCDYFTGRSKPLADIHKTLTARHVNIITGPSGIGKTQLVARYAHEKKSHYQAILWFDIKGDLDIQFILLAEMWCNLRKPTPKEAITAAYLYLKNKRTLLVFDNAIEAESLAPYLPPNPTAKNFHLLITSQNIDFGCIIPLKLSGLTLKEACDFVQQRLPHAGEKEISALVETVSDLPLALSQAITYIVEEHVFLQEYLQQVTDLRREFAKRLTETSSSEQNAVSTDAVAVVQNITMHPVFFNFFCVFRTIKPRSPAIVPILSACAYFAPDNIPSIWLETGLLGKAMRANMYLFAQFTLAEVQQALVLLQRYGLLQSNKPGFLQIHPLVQEVIRYSLTQNEQELYIGRIEQSLSLFNSSENNNLDPIKAWQVCVPHLQEVTKHHFESGFEKDSRLALALTLLGSHYFNNLNQAQRAHDLFEDAEAIVRSHADSDCLKDLNPSITICELGNHYLLNEPEKLEKTCDLFKLALNIKEKIFFQKYGVSCHEIVKIQKENCEEDLNKIVVITVQIGRIQCKLENFQESEKHIKAALNIVIEVYGQVHQKTFIRFVDLGEIYYEMKAFNKACLAFEKALGIQESCLSLSHPDLVETLKKLGDALEASQNLPGAVKIFERALRIQERYFSQNDYTKTGILLRKLAASYARMGSFKTQTELLERALKLQEKQTGSDDATKLFDILVELTVAYRNVKKNKFALYAAQRAYHIYRKNSDHSLKDLKQTTEYIKMLRNFFGDQLEDEPPKSKQRTSSMVAPHASFLPPPLQYKTVESKEVNLAAAQNSEDNSNDGYRRNNRKKREDIISFIARQG
ncbi:MAG: putative ATPase [Gammaproteobacteria bacterium]|jgi:tetratricopeptide (TPR) repeat protein|nr:putative ATPase [Gammaproteobacteria bacterium]